MVLAKRRTKPSHVARVAMERLLGYAQQCYLQESVRLRRLQRLTSFLVESVIEPVGRIETSCKEPCAIHERGVAGIKQQHFWLR